MTTEHEDARTEMIVLQRVIDHHPGCVTVSELTLELVGPRPDFETRDGLERAIRELTGAGLLQHTADDLLRPTRAAVYFSNLVEL